MFDSFMELDPSTQYGTYQMLAECPQPPSNRYGIRVDRSGEGEAVRFYKNGEEIGWDELQRDGVDWFALHRELNGTLLVAEIQLRELPKPPAPAPSMTADTPRADNKTC